jgi:integrase
MVITHETQASAGGNSTAALTLQDVLIAVEGNEGLSATRRRDLRSAVTRVASLAGQDPGGIPLDLPALRDKLSAVNPVSVGLTTKSFSNVKSDFLAAVKVSELIPIRRSSRRPLNADWTRMMSHFSSQRPRVGLSRLVHYASDRGIAPQQVDTAVIKSCIDELRSGSLRRNPNNVHRMLSQIWNEAARQPELGLQTVTVPSFRRPPQRIEWMLLPAEFRKDVDEYFTWCAGTDSFATDARPCVLRPRTITLRRNLIHTAVTALVESGVEPAAINLMADLVLPENFKRILRGRNQATGGRKNGFNGDIAKALVQIAREWVKVDAPTLAELRRLNGKVPTPLSGLTDKNKKFLRQFDDPAVLRRLFDLPNKLWAEVKRDKKANRLTLSKAQAALAIAILSYVPIRLQNLSALTFDVHLFMRDGARATSSLELPTNEVKNKREMAFDIPTDVAKMIIEYRDRIAPKVMGHRPARLFVNIDGTPKGQDAVADLITRYLHKRAGIVLTPHQFRHLSAKVLLDAEPGSFETVRQLLGHASLNTTVAAYAGIDTRRAARHHHHLIQQTLAAEKPTRRRRKRAS